MKLTRLQRKTLQAYCTMQLDNGSVIGQIWRNKWVFIYHLARFIIALPLMFLVDEWLGFLAMGLIIGTVIRDIQSFMQRKRVWPAIAEVLDWQRVDELLRS